MSFPPRPACEPGSLWTTPAAADTTPLTAAQPDPTVTLETLRAAVERARERAAAMSGQLTEELLRRTV